MKSKVLKGEVSECQENGVKINAEDGGSVNVQRESVVEILRWSAKTESNLKDSLGRYF